MNKNEFEMRDELRVTTDVGVSLYKLDRWD